MHDLQEADIHDDRLRRLFSYWLSRHVDGRPPSRANLDPLDFPYAVGFVTLVDVEHDPLRFRFRLVASPVTQHLGYELTGKYLSDIPEPQMRDYLMETYRRLIEHSSPQHERGERVLDRRVWQHESLLLPCCDEDGRLNMIISARVTRPPQVLPDPDGSILPR